MTPQNPLDCLEIVATNYVWCDPAIAVDRTEGEAPHSEELVQYRRTRDLSVLPKREGVSPTLFVLKPIPARVLSGIYSPAISPATRNALCFLRSCHLVKLPDGQALEPSRYDTLGDGSGKIAKEDWIDKIADLFGYETVQEIGGVAFERARLPRAARGPFCFLGGSAPRL